VAALLDLPVSEVAARAERALAARLLVEDEAGTGYELANDLVREVLYQTSPRPTRVTRHRRLAGMLADRPEAAAGHAAAGDWSAAATAWMAAAARAAAGSYANRDAERLLDRAVDAAAKAGDPALEARALLDRGRSWSPSAATRPPSPTSGGPWSWPSSTASRPGGGRARAARLDRLLPP